MLNIIELFCGALNITADRLHSGLSLGDIPEWDSVAHMSLVSTIEEQCSIMLEMDEITEMTSLAAIPEVLKRYGIEVADLRLLDA